MRAGWNAAVETIATESTSALNMLEDSGREIVYWCLNYRYDQLKFQSDSEVLERDTFFQSSCDTSNDPRPAQQIFGQVLFTENSGIWKCFPFGVKMLDAITQLPEF